jgi:hypothetical protein
MEQTYRLLQGLIDLGRTDVQISIVTNLSRLRFRDYDIFDLIEPFANVSFSVSVDGFGSRLEYMRKGADWDRLLENLNEAKRRFRSMEKVRTFKIFMSVYMLNAFHCVPTIEYFKNLGFPLEVNLSTSPAQSRLDYLPRAIKEKLATYYRANPSPQAEQILQFMLAESTDEAQAERYLAEQLEFTQHLDQIRGESFFATFPEWKEALAGRHLLAKHRQANRNIAGAGLRADS